MNYQIISDGCCDLTQDIIEKYNLRVVPFYISFDGENYVKEIEEIGIRDVYERMVSDTKVFPKTSLPSIQNYVDVFTEYAKQGIPVICICFTVALSGSYNSACNAKEIVEEEYPDAKIFVLDSHSGTVSQALMVMETGRMQQAGLSFEKTTEILEKMRDDSWIFFTVGNLDYLRKGGRIGRLASVAANALSLKPMIVLDKGEVTSGGVVRSRKKSYAKCFEMLKKKFEDLGEKITDYQYLIGYGYDIEEGEKFRSDTEKRFHDAGLPESTAISSIQIGATIAVHTGPHALGIGAVKKYECYL